MYKFYGFLFITGMLFLTPCYAEVSLSSNKITVNVHEITMQEILENISKQGHIHIVTLDESPIGHVKISRRFSNLPIEIGLERILNGWNYGMSRDSSTGKITTIYLLSQRTNQSTVPVPLSVNSPSSRHTHDLQPHPSTKHELNNDFEFLDSDDDNGEDDDDEFDRDPSLPIDNEF